MTETIILGGGCFWCTEAIFKKIKGVISTVPGYAGGDSGNPTYDTVSTGDTGHAEVVRIEFEPKIITIEKILEIFMTTHDPTTVNRQDMDVGSQYRSIVLYSNDQQKLAAEAAKAKIPKAVTEIKPWVNFYPAEADHFNYYFKNKDKPYCRFVISPKLEKLKEKYGKLMTA